MYLADINGIDPGVPDLNKTSERKFSDFSDILFDIYLYPRTYVGFPKIPCNLFKEGRLHKKYSIVKKGCSLFIVDRGDKGGKFLETMMPLSTNQIEFSFTTFDFPNFQNMNFEVIPEGLSTEPLMNTYVYDILSL